MTPKGKEKEPLSIGDVRLRPGEETLTIDVVVHNDLDRTLHTYATARRIDYDVAAGKLEIDLSDERVEPIELSGTFVRPKFVAVDPGGDRTIELELPKVMHRMGPPEGSSLSFEALPISEARSVKVRLAWSDTPFYPDVRGGKGAAPGSLRDWQKGSARAKFQIE